MAQPSATRVLASQAFSRASGAPLVPGNAVRLLCDARENYPAWLEAIGSARRQIHFECYIIHDDAVGRTFADALSAKARAGVHVRIAYDWMGALGSASRAFWRSLRRDGVEVRCFNPPRLDEPLGWLRRDHRKCLVVDGRIAFVTGLCVGRMWVGDPVEGIEPWRDTGVSIEGPAVREVALAFAETWASMGPPLPPEDLPVVVPPEAGNTALRVVADTSGATGLFRLDTLVAALARRTLWLTDAYYAGTSVYVQALRAAARDGVDVRLLVPGRGSDIAIVQAFSRAGYRPLLEAGVRVFEWNGPMIHAKTAVTDSKWARVGSTNLNIASWMGNWEMDVVVEDEAFARRMEDTYSEDLSRSTEIVLNPKGRVRRTAHERAARTKGGRGSASRAAAGALRIGNVVGAAITSRVLGPAESRLMAKAGFLLLVLAPVGFVWPRIYAWPLSAALLWMGLALLLGAWRARREESEPPPG